jgi:hypothetical protein
MLSERGNASRLSAASSNTRVPPMIRPYLLAKKIS